jgi:hypothetical protein
MSAPNLEKLSSMNAILRLWHLREWIEGLVETYPRGFLASMIEQAQFLLHADKTGTA